MVFLVLGRPVRELVAAAGRDSGGAHVPVERDHRRDGGAGVSPDALPTPSSRFRPALAYTIGGAGMPMDINIFTQIGFVVLVGLASKNAILIVEFAKRQRESGMPRNEAALAACKLRLRPIVMTSFAFILGVSPLLIAHGAGAEMRRTLGTAVFSGMLGVTLFGIFLTPVFFIVIDWLGGMNVFHSRLARWICVS